MDQGSDHIRQDIESTRASLDDKLNLLEDKAQTVAEKARETFDIRHQVSERPWVALGAAVAAGYILGSMGGDNEPEPRWTGHNLHTQPVSTWSNQPVGWTGSGEPSVAPGYSQSAPQHSGPSTVDTIKEKAGDFLSQFDDEINLIKSAAIGAITAYLRDTVRDLAPAIGQQMDQMRHGQTGGKQRSTAPNTAMRDNPTTSSADYDEVGQMNRFGNPPHPTATGSEYYETSATTPRANDERAVGQTERYNL